MAYFPINTTSTFRKPQAWLLYEDTLTDTMALKEQHTQARRRCFCTRAAQKPEKETGSRVFHEIRSPQIHIALCFGSQVTRGPGPRRAGPPWSTWAVAVATPSGTAGIQRGGTYVYASGMRGENERVAILAGRVSAALEGWTVPSVVLTSAKHGLEWKNPPFFGSHWYKYTQACGWRPATASLNNK